MSEPTAAQAENSKTKRMPIFHCTKPCASCPYRTDAPLQLWARAEFTALLKSEADPLGTVYGCHRNNGSVCVGWLMNQDARRFPSIALRMALSKHGVTRAYLDKLSSPAPLYPSVREMVKANYPELLKRGYKPKSEAAHLAELLGIPPDEFQE